MKSSGSILLSDTGNVRSNCNQHRVTTRKEATMQVFAILLGFLSLMEILKL